MHDARASPHRYCWPATGPHPRPQNGMHIPSRRPAGAGVRPVLKMNDTTLSTTPRYRGCNHQPILAGPCPAATCSLPPGNQADALAAHALVPSAARGCDGPGGAGRLCRSPPASHGSPVDLGDCLGEVGHHRLQGRVIISRAPVSYRADGVSGHPHFGIGSMGVEVRATTTVLTAFRTRKGH